MPDIIKNILIGANAALAFIILVFSLYNRTHEKRKGYLWIWNVLILLGLMWLCLYGIDIFGSPDMSLRDVMGSGIIRSLITLTLGAIVAIMTQLRIPRTQ